MTTGIWLLFYDISAADRDHYVDWFHRCHIPEKLAGQDYRSAVHFEAPQVYGNSDLFRLSRYLAATRPEYSWTQARPS